MLGNCQLPELKQEKASCKYLCNLNSDRYSIIKGALKTLDLEVDSNGDQIRHKESENLTQEEKRRLKLQQK